MQEVIDELFPEPTPFKSSLIFLMNSYEGSPPHLLAPTNSLGTFFSLLLGGFSPEHAEAITTREFSMHCFKNGNASFIEKIAEQLEGRIHCNKALTEISNGTQIELKFNDGSSACCEKLILAIPAAVYEDIRFDNEIISTEQLKLIRKVQCGNNSKILIPIRTSNIEHHVLFNDYMGAFFNIDRKLMNMYFINDDSSNSLAENFFQKGLDFMQDGHRYSEFSTCSPVEAQDQQYVKYDSPVLKSWFNDVYAKGSYSNYGVALQQQFDKVVLYKNAQVKEVFKPVDDRVFFVGEHTTLLEAIGTMEAAVESAERIASLF